MIASFTMTAGALLRPAVRRIVKQCEWEAREHVITLDEQKGFLDSAFRVKVEGPNAKVVATAIEHILIDNLG